MTLPLLIREMTADELPMVLSDWKKGLWDERPAWGRALQTAEWWALVNHVVDHVSVPTATVWMACHRNEPSVSLCWAAVRAGTFLHMHARVSVRDEPDLAAYLERELTAHAQGRPEPYNPFMELKLWPLLLSTASR